MADIFFNLHISVQLHRTREGGGGERNISKEKAGIRLRAIAHFAKNISFFQLKFLYGHAFSVWQLHFFLHKCDVHVCVSVHFFLCCCGFLLYIFFICCVPIIFFFFIFCIAAFHFPFCISSNAYCNFVAVIKWVCMFYSRE